MYPASIATPGTKIYIFYMHNIELILSNIIGIVHLSKIGRISPEIFFGSCTTTLKIITKSNA